jgi:hypothetical protein
VHSESSPLRDYFGKKKGREEAGFLLGLLLGVFGWLLVAFGPNFKPKCPYCGGEIVESAVKCKNCGSDLQEQEQS